MDDDVCEKQLEIILTRLAAEEQTHAHILTRIDSVEEALLPIADLGPLIRDWEATGRIGKMIIRFIIAISAILAAVAGMYYTVTHGFKP